MMEREALERLIEAVESGAEITGLDVHKANTGHSDHIEMVLRAHGGSLDAAKALHESLLPGWGFTVWTGESDDYGCNLISPEGQAFDSVYAKSEARARLLAILNAKLPEGER